MHGVSGGGTRCVLALGFEKMQKGSLSSTYTDRANPIQPHVETMMALRSVKIDICPLLLFSLLYNMTQ